MSDLEIIQLTPSGRGAVATLRVEGRRALEAVAAHFRARNGRPLSSAIPDRPIVGRFGDWSNLAPQDGEEVVLHCLSGEAVEIHCHGGLAAVDMIRQILLAAGGQEVAWQDWITRLEPDPIARAARLLLPEARTERTAAILLDQYHGALRRVLEALAKAPRNENRDSPRVPRLACPTVFSALLDKPAVAPTQATPSPGSLEPSAEDLIETLLARAPLGMHLVRPWRVVVAGPPNVGKSSLINALVGYPRALVHDAPGTTRDAVTAATAIDGWPIEFCDTAGLRRGGSALEQAGIALARQRLSDAEGVILVFDHSQPWSAAEDVLLSEWPGAIVVHNKGDLAEAGANRPAGLTVSSLFGQGIPALLQAVVDRLVPSPPPPGAAVPFTAEQVEQIKALGNHESPKGEKLNPDYS
ncbi:MAG: GTPase [Thermoguttaceae bacterium]